MHLLGTVDRCSMPIIIAMVKQINLSQLKCQLLGTVNRGGIPIIVAIVKQINLSQLNRHLLGNINRGTYPILVACCYDKTNHLFQFKKYHLHGTVDRGVKIDIYLAIQ